MTYPACCLTHVTLLCCRSPAAVEARPVGSFKPELQEPSGSPSLSPDPGLGAGGSGRAAAAANGVDLHTDDSTHAVEEGGDEDDATNKKRSKSKKKSKHRCALGASIGVT